MWTNVKLAAIAAAFLAGATAPAYAQGSMTQDPGKMMSGKSPSGPGATASGGNGTLGAGDVGIDWTGTNPGVNRGPAGSYGPGYSGPKVAPGGNGTLGAGDSAVGGWTGTNPGVDRRSTGGANYGRYRPGYR